MYSHAVYTSEDESLEQAVERKLEYIREVCRLKPGSRVLDVGAGWGSFARYAAARGIHVTMLTVSQEQKRYLAELSGSRQFAGDLRVVAESIYDHAAAEPYDAVVILGVMEHLPEYAKLFARLDRLLKRHGRVYMCFCAIRKKYGMSTITYRHVYEGNQSPVVLPELMAAANAGPFELIEAHMIGTATS
jgi:cyclopropane-fatty-acyl-phospholipid synthase